MAESKPVSSELFSQRKRDHIEISLKDESQSVTDQFAHIQLQHNPLPEINFDEVSLATEVFGHSLKSPLFISSMTLGHEGAANLNETLVEQAQARGWMMGVGSQRRQLFDPKARGECESLRSKFPNAVLFGNLGLSQIIEAPTGQVQDLVESLGAQFLVVHTNPLQEAIQPEGTPQFKGGLAALENLCSALNVPVVLKEVGCGFNEKSFNQLKNTGLKAIDVSGRGGTHWGRVEGLRINSDDLEYKVAATFSDWGLSTVDSLQNGINSKVEIELWASGGVRSGLDAAKLLAMGATKIGFAQPILQAALQSSHSLAQRMEQLESELKIAMFCLGTPRVENLVGNRDMLKWI